MNNDGFSNKTSYTKKRPDLPSAPNYIIIINTVLILILSSVILYGSLFTQFLLTTAAAILFSVNLLSKRSFWVLLAIPFSYIASFVLCKDAIAALLSLLYVPFAILIAVFLYSSSGCSQTIIAYTALSVTVKILLLSGALIITYGSLTKGINAYMTGLENTVNEFVLRLQESDAFAEITIPDSLSSQLVRMAVSLTPGILILWCEIEAAIAVRLCWRYLKKLRIAPALRPGGWTLTVGRPVGIIFAVSYVSSFLLSVSSSTAMFSYAAINLTLVMMPPIFLTGIRTFKEKMSKFSGIARFGIIVGALSVALFVPAIMTLGFMLICFAGTLSTIKNKPGNTDRDNH